MKGHRCFSCQNYQSLCFVVLAYLAPRPAFAAISDALDELLSTKETQINALAVAALDAFEADCDGRVIEITLLFILIKVLFRENIVIFLCYLTYALANMLWQMTSQFQATSSVDTCYVSVPGSVFLKNLFETSFV